MENWTSRGPSIPYWGAVCEGWESLVEWLQLYWDSGIGGQNRRAAIFRRFRLFFLVHMGRYRLKRL